MYCPLLLLLAAIPGADSNWPAFRGGPAGGVSHEAGLPIRWSTTENVAWKADIPGKGWSSPVVWGRRAFVTSVVSAGKSEAARKGLYFGGERLKPPPDVHRWMLYCLDLDSGKVVWERQLHEAVPETTRHIKNSYASETPVTDGRRVYAYFGDIGVFCLDMDGKPLWSRAMPHVKTRFGWGTAASPALHAGRLFIVNDNEQQSFLLCLDAVTGKERWRIDRPEKTNWATPYVWENEQRTEVVTAGAGKVRSYDLDGKLLWELGGMSSLTIPTPCAAHGLLFVSSGYVLDTKRPIFAIRPGARGDISLKKDKTSNASIAWSVKTGGPYNPSPVAYGDNLYVLYDRGLLACYEARTGKPVYPPQRLGRGADAFTASPWVYDGLVFCLSEEGETFVIQAGPTFKVVGKNKLDEMALASPAIADGRLLVRTASKLYCIRGQAAR